MAEPPIGGAAWRGLRWTLRPSRPESLTTTKERDDHTGRRLFLEPSVLLETLSPWALSHVAPATTEPALDGHVGTALRCRAVPKRRSRPKQ